MNKPAYLGIRHAERFKDQSVVDRYHLRPTYPPETFNILAGLIVDVPRVVLDAGCGSGEVARGLIDFVERIDAIDFSWPMLEKGKTLPGGDSPKIRWLYGSMEDNPTYRPVNLIEELEKRRLFQKEGEAYTTPVPFEQSLHDYIESFHARSSLSRDHMTCEMATAFDEEVKELVSPFTEQGKIPLQVRGHITWGKPLGAPPSQE